MEIFLIIFKVTLAIFVLMVIMILYVSYHTYSVVLNRYLDEKDIIIHPYTEKEIIKELREKFYKGNNIFIMGNKLFELNKQVSWSIRTEFISKIEKLEKENQNKTIPRKNKIFEFIASGWFLSIIGVIVLFLDHSKIIPVIIIVLGLLSEVIKIYKKRNKSTIEK